jgi:hypothetical protein
MQPGNGDERAAQRKIDALGMPEPLLRQLDENLWVLERPLRVFGLEIGARMTVIRLANGEIFLHSPVELDAETRAALGELGPVRHIAAPNKVHHLYFGEVAAAYPEATRYAAPGLPEKRQDLSFHEVLGEDPPAAWSGEIDQLWFRGAPHIEEIVFCHRPSRTLLLTDLAFNVRESRSLWTQLWLRANGVYGKFGPSRLVRRLIRDEKAARACLDRILAWDFDRVVVSHGVVLQSRGRRVLRDAYKWMG